MKPLIATPCYDGKVCINYFISIARLNPVPEIIAPSGALVTYARNDCVANFMAGNWSHLFFIDSDIGFEPAAFRRVLASGYDVAAGAYSHRIEGETSNGGFVGDFSGLGPVGEDGFAVTEDASTGFMCIARRVFEKMAAAGIGKHEFFDTMRLGDEYVAEDAAFCKRWRALGGLIHLDTRSALTHQGVKFYQRDFGAYLKGKS